MKGRTGRPPSWSYWVVLPSFVVVWGLLAWLLDSPLLPTPMNVLEALIREAASGELWHHLGATLARVVVAFILAMV
ncbi:MAG: ABC transporter permease, partial [Pseudomonadota bacterium]|nr:ABC transporter permease [Pseudomonadota bacterium]